MELKVFVQGIIRDIQSAVEQDKGVIEGGINFEVSINKTENKAGGVKIYVADSKKGIEKECIAKIRLKISLIPLGYKNISELLDDLDKEKRTPKGVIMLPQRDDGTGLELEESQV